MIGRQRWRIAFGVAGMLLASAAQAQTAAPEQCSRTRAEVREECVQYLKLHRWDEASNNWVLKEGQKPPAGVSTRAQIRTERLNFLRNNRWNDALSQWEPLTGTSRDLSKLNRAEVRKETRAFMRTHVWDEASGTYVERKTK